MYGSIDINCTGYEIKSSSIGHGQDGYVFRCTISPVAQDVFNRLTTAAQLGATIRLVFPSRPLLLEDVMIERVDIACIRIIGHVVEGRTEKGLPY